MKFASFPPSSLDALNFHLLAFPFVHEEHSNDYLWKRLTRPGDFLVSTKSRTELTLCLRVDEENISVFPIKFSAVQTERGEIVGFDWFGELFSTLNGLIQFVCTSRCTAEGKLLRFKTAIYKKHVVGTFGYGSKVDIGKETVQPYFIRSLCNRLASNRDVESILEDLCQLKHENLCSLFDFECYSIGVGIPPIILVQCEPCVSSLNVLLSSLNNPLSVRRYVTWCHQVCQAINYLLTNGATCKRLSLRSCLLTSSENVKLTDFWVENDKDNYDWWYSSHATKGFNPTDISAFTHDDAWRSVPPEVLLGSLWSDFSLVWTVGLLAQQIFTHGRFPGRFHFASLPDFLQSNMHEEFAFFPGTKQSSKYAKNPAFKTHFKYFMKMSANYPQTPAVLGDIFTKCLQLKIEDRPLFSEVMKACEKEYKLCRLALALSKVVL